MAENQKTQRDFVPGLDLAEAFFEEAVAPVLAEHLPDLAYSAALVGPGSEVLGFDDPMSTDHHWGPRLMLFLEPAVLQEKGPALRTLLGNTLPRSFRGYPTNWTQPDPNDGGVQHLEPSGDGRVNHRVELFTLRGFFDDYMGLDPVAPLSAADWLTLPHQKLRSACAGRVFRDDLDLAAIRRFLSWYPHDVWLYVLASSWSRIGQEEHLMGRAGLVGDELGSAVIAARLVREVMRLGFLMERTYPPYPKWFGTAFAHLACASLLEPVLKQVLGAGSWREREGALVPAYRHMAEMHNALGITAPLSTEPSSFWGRPFTVIHGERFAESLRAAVRDPEVAAIAEKGLIGSIDVVSDNTDLLEHAGLRGAVRSLYE